MRKALASIAVMVSLTAGASTKILFSFDTEDYTCDRSNDAIRDIANVLRAEGVRGNFNIVGYLATRLVELGRFDVIDALKGHVIGSQTLYHSRQWRCGRVTHEIQHDENLEGQSSGILLWMMK